MSKGLGRMERLVLYYVVDGEHEEPGYETRDTLAMAVFDAYEARPDPGRLSSMNRAIRSLKRKGLLTEDAWPRSLRATETGRAVAEGLHPW